MALVGGALGELVKYFTNPGKFTVINSILKGILPDFFVFVVYSEIFNEFAVLGFSALVAFFGIYIRTPKAD